MGTDKLTVGSCFSGIGGLELGLEWTGGFETKWQIENDPYASRVLAKHWPDVKRYSDIRDVSNPPTVDVISGGFPCQDVSLAGARAGLEGKRSTLWSEMFRLVCEVKPRWVVAENVPGLLSSDGGRFFGNILRDLASIGFDAEWGVLSAAGVGAPHLRKRVFILAHTQRSKRWPIPERRDESNGDDAGREETTSRIGECGQDVPDPSRNERGIFDRDGQDVADTKSSGRRQKHPDGGRPSEGTTAMQERRGSPDSGWWETEPDVDRVVNGLPLRVDRLRCLGNAVVPQVAQKIGEMILTSL